MGHKASKLPAQSHVLTAKDSMAAFRLFDNDDTGKLEYDEIKVAFDTMLDPATVDISCYEGQTFDAAKFRDVAEQLNRTVPQLNVIGNLAKYVRDNREKEDDDGEDIKSSAIAKLFAAFDPDGSGEMSYMELFKLFMFLKIPLEILFSAGAAQDGSVTSDEFEPFIRKLDSDHPDLDIDEKINAFVAALPSGGKPELPDEEPDAENDPAQVEEEEEEAGTKKALLVGINYIGSSCELGGCINDVRNEMAVLTEQFGFSEENILLLTEDQDDDSKVPKAETIRTGLQWLIDGASPGDLLVFAYSGHGSQLPCSDGSEPDGKNEILCPFDLQEDWYANSIDDNYLFDVFFNQVPEGVRCVCIYDCCHSASMEDLSCTRDFKLPGADEEEEEPQKSRFVDPPDEVKEQIETARQAACDSGATKDMSVPDDINKKLIWTISGCQDNQTSADATIGGVRQGAMTWALLESLKEGGLKGPYHYHYDRLLSSMKKKLAAGGYSQVPSISTTEQALFNRYYLSFKP